jgi:hypothetical protein
MIAIRILAATAMIASVTSFAGAASASPANSSADFLMASAADGFATDDQSMSSDPHALQREAESRGRKNEPVHNHNRRGRGK